MKRLIGLGLMGAAALAVTLHLWLSRSVLVPIAQQPLEFAFISASLGTFLVIALAAMAALAGVHALIRSRDQRSPELFSRDDVAYVAPLVLFASSLLGLLTLVPDLPKYVSVVTYVVVDVRWWWTAAILGWTLTRLDRRMNGALRALVVRGVAAAPAWAPAASLAALALVWVVIGTPARGFSSGKSGDEPKYLRYCESLYQGIGFEMSEFKTIAERGADDRPRVWRNFVLIARTIPGELRELAADAAARIRGTRRTGGGTAEATPAFVVGRHGGFFQLHSGGVPMLLFPAYYLDRRFSAPPADPDAQLPARLVAVTSTLVGMYVAWVLLIFRFVRRCIGSRWASWIATVAVTFTLPVAAFPFQVYPEIAAGLSLLILIEAVLFPSATWRHRWLFLGLLAGYLPWLHMRFGAVAAVVAVFALVRLRRQAGNAARFATGLLVPLICLSLYTYNITGSLMPTSLWDVVLSAGVFSWSGAWRGALGYLIDRDWGLFPHTPVLLPALPGFVWLARRQPMVTAITAVTLVALVTLAGGHTLVAAGSTPMRIIVAVVPLFALPLAELLARRGRREVWAAFAVLLVASLHTALAYNGHDQAGPMRDASVSGWKPNLLFPLESRWPGDISAVNVVDMAVWIAVIVGLLCAPVVIARARRREQDGPIVSPRRPWPALAGAAVALLVVIAVGFSVLTGAWIGERYQMRPEQAVQKATVFLGELGHCGICATSNGGRLSTREIADRLARAATLNGR